jgi:hypothetical protein
LRVEAGKVEEKSVQGRLPEQEEVLEPQEAVEREERALEEQGEQE